jgi:hypothetical protein
MTLNVRRAAAELAQAFYRGEVTFQELSKRYPDSDDPDVEELLDLIEHEPKQGGLLGAPEAEYREHMSRITRLINGLLHA